MRFDGVDFNEKSVSRMSEEQFVNHEMHVNHYKRLPEKKKKELLKNIYRIIKRVVALKSDTSENKGQG
jgi:hypothetical protein